MKALLVASQGINCGRKTRVLHGTNVDGNTACPYAVLKRALRQPVGRLKKALVTIAVELLL